ncbi:MAG: hypothetical protein LBT02_00055 [Rickettsiales bacterium]|jgi:hypothetical protein|nr:hypothetical protein [Rickettsiales bacterium]
MNILISQNREFVEGNGKMLIPGFEESGFMTFLNKEMFFYENFDMKQSTFLVENDGLIIFLNIGSSIFLNSKNKKENEFIKFFYLLGFVNLTPDNLEELNLDRNLKQLNLLALPKDFELLQIKPSLLLEETIIKREIFDEKCKIFSKGVLFPKKKRVDAISGILEVLKKMGYFEKDTLLTIKKTQSGEIILSDGENEDMVVNKRIARYLCVLGIIEPDNLHKVFGIREKQLILPENLQIQFAMRQSVLDLARQVTPLPPRQSWATLLPQKVAAGEVIAESGIILLSIIGADSSTGVRNDEVNEKALNFLKELFDENVLRDLNGPIMFKLSAVSGERDKLELSVFKMVDGGRERIRTVPVNSIEAGRLYELKIITPPTKAVGRTLS